MRVTRDRRFASHREAWGRVDGVGRDIAVALAPTRHRYAVRDHFQPSRSVDGGLALFFALGHAPVVELAGHAALLGAAHGRKRGIGYVGARRRGCAAVSGDSCWQRQRKNGFRRDPQFRQLEK